MIAPSYLAGSKFAYRIGIGFVIAMVGSWVTIDSWESMLMLSQKEQIECEQVVGIIYYKVYKPDRPAG